MSLRVTVTKLDLSPIEKKFSEAGTTKGRIAVANQVLMDSDRFVPRRSGAMRAAARVNNAGRSVNYYMVYARAHFYGTNGIVVFRKYTVGGTGPKWLEKAAAANMSNWENIAVKAMGL